MKRYTEDKESRVLWVNEENGSITIIPKDPANTQYTIFLQELEKGEAELIPYVPPAPTWEQIRSQRDGLLKDSDWSVASDATPKPSKEVWLSYRQALRDLPSTFKTPEEVVWPEKP